jgi:hypothetical protein
MTFKDIVDRNCIDDGMGDRMEILLPFIIILYPY